MNPCLIMRPILSLTARGVRSPFASPCFTERDCAICFGLRPCWCCSSISSSYTLTIGVVAVILLLFRLLVRTFASAGLFCPTFALSVILSYGTRKPQQCPAHPPENSCFVHFPRKQLFCSRCAGKQLCCIQLVKYGGRKPLFTGIPCGNFPCSQSGVQNSCFSFSAVPLFSWCASAV